MPRRTAAEAEETRKAVLAAARRLFAEQGYNGVSVPACAEAAGVTHGGLYHHYASKAILFKAVFQEITEELNAYVLDQALTGSSMRDGFLKGCRASIEFMTGAEYQQIALSDAPAVFGWNEWRTVDSDVGFPSMMGGIKALTSSGLLSKAPDLAAIGVLLFGGLTEAAIRVAKGDDNTDVDAIIDGIDAIIAGLS